jgi:hypothetical protein
MLNLQQNFKDIFGVDALPALDEVMLDAYQSAEDPRAMLFSMDSTDREIKQYSSITSLGTFNVTGEAEQAAKEDFNQSYNKTHTIIKYAKAIGISDEMIADARFDIIQKMVRSLGRSARETQLITAMNIYNNSFSTATSWDGVALISSAHPSPIGNQSNSLGTVDIAYSTLQTAEQTLRKTQDQAGKRLYIRPSVVVVPEESRHVACEYVKSPYKADVANNNINSLGMDGGLTVVSSPFITDPDAFWVQSKPEDHGLMILDREALSQKMHEDVLAGVLYYVANYRQSVDINDWRGIVGTAGNG